MNCANHSDIAAVAFCRTCGKPLCQTCTRDVRGVIYCESCLAARLDGTAPAAGFVPPAQTVYPPGGPAYVQPGAASSGPNPTVAGILAAFSHLAWVLFMPASTPKGLSHMVIMVLLIIGLTPIALALSTMLGISNRIFLRVPDHRCGANSQSDSDGRARARSVRAWRRRLVECLDLERRCERTEDSLRVPRS